MLLRPPRQTEAIDAARRCSYDAVTDEKAGPQVISLSTTIRKEPD